MPNVTEFTKREILKTFQLKSKYKSVIAISSILNRSTREIYRVISRSNNFARKPKCERPHVTNVQTYMKTASKQNLTPREIKKNPVVSVSKCTIHRHKIDCKNIAFKLISCRPRLKLHHKLLDWVARECICRTDTSSSPYYLATERSLIRIFLMAGVATDMTSGNTDVLSLVERKAVTM